MIKFNSFALALFMSAAVLTSCKKDDDKKATPTYSPEFSAKVDGQPWAGTAASAIKPREELGGLFQLEAVDNAGATMRIRSGADKVNGTGTYTKVVGQYQLDKSATETDLYTSDFGGSAELTITKYDTIDGRISGTFSFTAEGYNISGEKVVTDGEFKDVLMQ